MRYLTMTLFATVLLISMAGCSGGGSADPVDGSGVDAAGEVAGEGIVGETANRGETITMEEALVEEAVCQPDCGERVCGSDGCDGTCGECKATEQCIVGKCSLLDPCQGIEDCLPEICLESGECSGCSSDEECGEANLVCDEVSGLCVACAGNEDCEDGFGCENNECVELFCPDIDCPEGQVCDTAAHECVDCLSVDDCEPFEECIDNACVPPTTCESSKDCADDEVCDKAVGVCVECAEDADCDEGYRCTNSECVEILFCASDKDCKDYDKVCNKDIGECVDCLTDLDCAAEQFCLVNVCEDDVCQQSGQWPMCVETAVMACNENGSLLSVVQQCDPQEFCYEAECHPWVCEPVEVACDGSVAYECNDLGSGFVWETDCAETEEACSGGECKEVVCEPGKINCLDPLSIVWCWEDGTGFDITACGDGHYCETGACVPWLCEPGSAVCDANISLTCNEYGNDMVDPVDCADDGMVCVAGQCQLCDPLCGDKQCGADACGGNCGDCGAVGECMGGFCLDTTCPDVCVGGTNEAFKCGIELCYPALVTSAVLDTPQQDPLDQMFTVQANYGGAENDMQPKAGPSLAIMATGKFDSGKHADNMPPQGGVSDLLTGEKAFDMVRATIELTAPPGAIGFRIDYAMLSMEFNANQPFNDAFFIILNGPQTTDGENTAINYMECPDPEEYKNFDADGVSWCYIVAYSGFLKSPADAGTNIGGTGFTGTTGWLRTTWPIAAGEAFTLKLRIQDTKDGLYDSAVVVDNFQWVYEGLKPGTVVL